MRRLSSPSALRGKRWGGPGGGGTSGRGGDRGRGPDRARGTVSGSAASRRLEKYRTSKRAITSNEHFLSGGARKGGVKNARHLGRLRMLEEAGSWRGGPGGGQYRRRRARRGRSDERMLIPFSTPLPTRGWGQPFFCREPWWLAGRLADGSDPVFAASIRGGHRSDGWGRQCEKCCWVGRLLRAVTPIGGRISAKKLRLAGGAARGGEKRPGQSSAGA